MRNAVLLSLIAHALLLGLPLSQSATLQMRTEPLGGLTLRVEPCPAAVAKPALPERKVASSGVQAQPKTVAQSKPTRPRSESRPAATAVRRKEPTANNRTPTKPQKAVEPVTPSEPQTEDADPQPASAASNIQPQGAETAQKTSNGVPAQDVAFGSMEGPAFRKRVLPRYPVMAKRQGLQGSVLLRLHLDAQGSLEAVEVLKSVDPCLERAALEAVRKSTYRPAQQEGKPVACSALLPIRFALRKN